MQDPEDLGLVVLVLRADLHPPSLLGNKCLLCLPPAAEGGVCLPASPEGEGKTSPISP